jgi:hypothetical protein
MTLFAFRVTLFGFRVTPRVTPHPASSIAKPALFQPQSGSRLSGALRHPCNPSARLAGVVRWRRRAALGVLGLWGVVSLAQLSRLIEPPAPPPGGNLTSTLAFLKATIPSDAGYLYVEPGEFGTDTGVGQRLRYELYPRTYDDVRASMDEAAVRQLMQDEGLSFIVVPDASQYAPTSWLRLPPVWLRPIELDANRYVLATAS